MSRIIEMLARAGEKGTQDGDPAYDELPVLLRRAVAAGDAMAVARLIGIDRPLCGFVAAPDNEPDPADVPVEPDSDTPESPDAAAA